MYTIGIDLGTTNTSVCYTKGEGFQQYLIHQLVSEGLVDARAVLPSVVYIPAEDEFSKEDVALPWEDDDGVIVGEMAKRQSVRAGYRVVSSAKSWLCHTGIDRRAANLPWGADIKGKLSAFDVTVKILEHIRNSWNHDFKKGLLEGSMEDQQIVISVPASFDPAARELTTAAATAAGFVNLRLIEEPQAALYAWIEEQGENWREELEVGKRIFVCDVGGGTTDFSLMEAEDESGTLALRRVAVGNHILLGGDNMDLALAHLLKKRLQDSGSNPDERQWNNLVSQARDAKEELLTGNKDKVEIVLTGSGSGLFRSAMKTELTKEDVSNTILSGFFADCALSDRPKQLMSGGLREIGLNYARDAAVLKHIAAFLCAQEGGFVKPDYILFNGSMFAAGILRERIIGNIDKWGGENQLKALVSRDFSLSVSRGACYYGRVAEGDGIRIKASLPFSYYIGVEKSCMAVPGVEPELSLLCIAEHGMEEGSSLNISDKSFYLVFGETVQFRLFRSPFRKDRVGFEIDESADSFEEVTNLEKTLELADSAQEPENGVKHVAVNLESCATEVGTLDVFCIDGTDQKKRWKLEFDVRVQG
jgi:hypothetical protein